MADAKISSFASHGTPVGADYVASVLASGPTSKRLLASDLRDYTNLLYSASSADANVTGVINTLHVIDISGYTASRNFTLPATAAVGDRVGVALSVGDDTYGLILKADTGDGIIADNSTYTAAEWTRLLTKGEIAIFRCIVANTTWIVESRKLNACFCTMLKNTNTAVSDVTVTKLLLNETNVDNVGGQADPTTNNRINIRRTGLYKLTGYMAVTGTGMSAAQVRIHKNGSAIFVAVTGSTGTAGGLIPASIDWQLSAGDYLELNCYHNTGGSRTLYGASADFAQAMAIQELL